MTPMLPPPSGPDYPRGWSESSATAVARFDPRPTAFRKALATLVAATSRGLMLHGNRLVIRGKERLETARSAPGRGLLTYSNHVCLFDDPWLIACLSDANWDALRWIAADAMNFFGSSWKGRIFNAGKCVPVVRGAGLDQPGMHFLAERLRAGDWVHVFPEGGRSREEGGRLRTPLKAGLAQLVKAAEPILIPFYHRGMHEVLPIGTHVPRLGRSVQLLFGTALDSKDGIADLSAEDITLWVEQTLRRLEGEMGEWALD